MNDQHNETTLEMTASAIFYTWETKQPEFGTFSDKDREIFVRAWVMGFKQGSQA
jgi:hypothetical protein